MSKIEPIKPAAKFRNPIRTRRNSLIVAVVIIAFSVVAINVAIKTLSGAKEYLVAAGPVAAGIDMSEVEMTSVSLNLGSAGSDYLSPETPLDGLVLAQPLAAGDLVLKRDVVEADSSEQRMRLTVTAKTALPSKLDSGQLIDLWAAANDGSGIFGEPALIAQNVQVYSSVATNSLFGEAANKVELLATAIEIKPILAAILHGDSMSVVAHVGID
ncbi:MAG: hypothetical protein RL196_1402 [Actinomycetota bacterium]